MSTTPSGRPGKPTRECGPPRPCRGPLRVPGAVRQRPGEAGSAAGSLIAAGACFSREQRPRR
ncbi:hypothetical protein EOE66_00330 [Rubrivivax rivuli]|uniref:Uncharacterized protein n=1 Tax=Rubrivivax rivuli TaxID=1862385 RepID=A0A437RSX5_9BURK|nr:hypothetical protein EOE66_00330 [Rubrivivax rivuli]